MFIGLFDRVCWFVGLSERDAASKNEKEGKKHFRQNKFKTVHHLRTYALHAMKKDSLHLIKL